MENSNQSEEIVENKHLKTYEEAEVDIVEFENDVITTSAEKCLAVGTKIVMADGLISNIEDIKVGDFVMNFDHEKGAFVSSEITYVYKCIDPKCCFTLKFDNGNELSIVGAHDLFEQESNKYVCISEENAKEFIGKHYYCVDSKTYVELVDVVQETNKVEYYELYTAKTLNLIANGMLNVADDVDFALNIYEFDENLKANPKTLEEDIKKYGLYEYSEDIGFSKQEYENWGMPYINICISKGLTTFDFLNKQHSTYLKQR